MSERNWPPVIAGFAAGVNAAGAAVNLFPPFVFSPLGPPLAVIHTALAIVCLSLAFSQRSKP